ncbi:hypothetical protein B9Z19DRAFT_349653 [Tuber borchii]|uniref:Uncharacterized protein n=1 Tax=Tuber borchii TaxID=42251 RepID=A0A2T7A4W9_TUBBO|nr:hypothetical protein B9Z19DRAFT_349653 [Tuber borchii]
MLRALFNVTEVGYILCSCFRSLGIGYVFGISPNDLEKVHLLSGEESQNECPYRGSPNEETVAAIDTQLTHPLCPKGPRLTPWGFIQPYKLTDV